MRTEPTEFAKAVRQFLALKFVNKDLAFTISPISGSPHSISVDHKPHNHRRLTHGNNLCDINVIGAVVSLIEVVDYGRTGVTIKFDLNNPNSLDMIANKIGEIYDRRRDTWDYLS